MAPRPYGTRFRYAPSPPTIASRCVRPEFRGEGNGYLLEIERLRIYIAGDTELIPEMEHLGPIDIAFLPKNLPYTMSDQMFIEAARLIRPAVLYPYHYFEIDRTALQEALPDIKIR